jgi:initiation factor 1A
MKMLGNGRLTAFCFDGKNRLCHIRGKLRKKVWINTGDIILVGLRDYQDDKVFSIFLILNNKRNLLGGCNSQVHAGRGTNIEKFWSIAGEHQTQ